jgi:predicted permease
MTVPMSLSADTVEKRRAFYSSLLDHILAQPGIQSAGFVNKLPLTESESLTTLWIEGDPNRKGRLVEGRAASAGYFTAMRTPVLRGRNFTPAEDSTEQQPVVLVNQTFASTFFAGRNPIGQHLRGNSTAPWSTIIGVVADVRYESLETAAMPQIYSPFLASYPPAGGVSITVRSSLSQAAVVMALRYAVHAVDPNLALLHVRMMSDLTAQANAPRRFQTTLLTVFSVIAFFLAVVGVYGLVAYSVRQRTGEIGLRMALGATRSAIVRLVLRQGFALLFAGYLLGMVGAICFSHVLRSFLYEVPAIDPVILSLVPAALVAAGLGACAIPGFRAASVDAIVALRHE